MSKHVTGVAAVRFVTPLYLIVCAKRLGGESQQGHTERLMTVRQPPPRVSGDLALDSSPRLSDRHLTAQEEGGAETWGRDGSHGNTT
ncbi:unnamed protein product [Arctogadus glacialis]